MNATIDISNTVLKTKRLILRPWQTDDLEDLYAYASVDGVGQMAGWLPHESQAESARILQNFIEGKKTFALEHAGKVIGSLGIEKYREDEFPEFKDLRGRELGFVLAKDYWGQGLMPEAVKEVIRYLFAELGLDFILCGHFPHNTQSAKVQAKCGLTFYKASSYETQKGIVTTLISILRNTTNAEV